MLHINLASLKANSQLPLGHMHSDMRASMHPQCCCRYQLWRREVLNQRRLARRFVKFLWLAMIPLAAGLAVSRSDKSVRELLQAAKRRFPKKPLQSLKPSSSTSDDDEDEEGDAAAQAPPSKPDQHGKKFFWF